MNKNFSTIITTILVINIFIACFIAFYLTSQSSSLLENQRVIETLVLDLDEDIHELQERLIVIEAFAEDIDEDIYDACHWMARFVVTNKGNRKITNFCTIMKVDKKTFELCYGQNKKIKISSNEKKTFLINLTSLFQVPIDAEKPIVRIISK